MKGFKTVSLADQVFEQLENDIIQGIYPRGEILTELKLAEQLGVSRTPIREALRRLEQERLISDAGKGSVVLGITEDDILDIKEILKEHNAPAIRIIAKIENMQGINNIDEILEEADGIMIARGDMGVEIPYEEVPVLQKKLIDKAKETGKVVITATQMLDSMMHHPRPTRAEATDVANAIYDGTEAIMLSGETAAGQYPIEALETMVKIAKRTEKDIDYRDNFFRDTHKANPNVTDAICHATCTTAYDLNAKAIVTVTTSGISARNISKYRPSIPIIACTTDKKVCRQLSISFGMYPMYLEEKNELFELFNGAIEAACRKELLEKGDLVVLTAGVPLGCSGTTNMIKVQTV